MARTPFRVLATLALSLVLGLAQAQETYDAQDNGVEVDPPDRAARLALIRGEVSMQPAGEEDWAPALLNRPLTTGDKIWTENGARAEIQVGQAAVRLDSNTGFSFLNLDDDSVQMRMTAGTIIVDVRALTGREQIEIDTPNVALTLLRRGSYRVEVNDAGDVTTVRIGEGEAQATGGSQDVIVHSRQVATFRGYDDLVADWGTLGAPDDFDNWSMDRERRLDRLASSKSSQYVSREVTGYDDLDDYGSWSSEAEYGYVWTPRVAVGWSPYSYGRWVWVSPWGWTWIDDSPWGYAPFHYGRWAHVRNRWCWVPGPRHVRAVYAPALVGWGGWSGGYVSWYPLGPGDVYSPGRRHSRRYWDRVNFANSVIDRARVAQAYEHRGSNDRRGGSNWNPRNRGVPGAVTQVPRDSFAGSHRTGDRRVRVEQRDWARGNDNPAAPNIAPVRDSRYGGNARVHPRMAAALANRPVVVRRDPPPSAARYTRRPPSQVDTSQNPAVVRQQDRGRERPEEPRVGDLRDRRNRTDDRPAREVDPDTRSSVRDSRGIADRVREDRDRQVREARQRNPEQQPQQQAPDAQAYQPQERSDRPSQAWRRQQQDQPREQRESNEQENSLRAREFFQRQRDSERQRRDVDQPRVEQPRVEQQRTEQPRNEQPRYERPREQPRMEQPRAEQPRYERQREQPRQEQPREQPRSEAPREDRSSRSSSPPPQQQDRGPRDRGRDDFKSKRN